MPAKSIHIYITPEMKQQIETILDWLQTRRLAQRHECTNSRAIREALRRMDERIRLDRALPDDEPAEEGVI